MAVSKAFQVNLRPEQHRQLHELAKRRGQSMGSLVRESVAEYLAGIPATEDPLADIAGLFEDKGPRPHGEVGESHDAYLAEYVVPAADPSDKPRPRRRIAPGS